jgi:SAM-dependent methyltransferase
MTTANPAGDYDAYAPPIRGERGVAGARRVEGDPFGLLPPLLTLLGDITGCRVLDAGCGEGYLARVLAAREARVTGIDLSLRLIELARVKNPTGDMDYRVADFSQPVPGIAGRFDAVASYLVLNDVQDYRGFAATPAASLKPGGRAVLALNNPYGAVLDRHVADYFSSGTASPTAACGKPASRPTTTTGPWRTTSTPSSTRACTSPSSPTSPPAPIPTGPVPVFPTARAALASCSWRSGNPAQHPLRKITIYGWSTSGAGRSALRAPGDDFRRRAAGRAWPACCRRGSPRSWVTCTAGWLSHDWSGPRPSAPAPQAPAR